MDDITDSKQESMRPGARLLLYLLLVFALSMASALVGHEVFWRSRESFWRSHVIWPVWLLFRELWWFGIVLGAAVIMSRIEHRSMATYGLALHSPALKRFGQGLLLGFAEISALIGVVAAFGGYAFGSLELRGIEAARWAGIWLLVFTAVGLFEEFAFRGYTQFTLADGIGFWPAAILLSAAFGAVHLTNSGENWIGALGVFAVGLVFAFSLKRTGSLWLAVGMHAGFDFGETFMYSVPNSGVEFEGHLSHSTLLSNKSWLTGGSAGPEASVFAFFTLLLVALAIHFLFPYRGRANERTTSGESSSVHQI